MSTATVDVSRLIDTGMERAFVAALISRPELHDTLPATFGLDALYDLHAQHAFTALANVRARGGEVSPAAIVAEVERTQGVASSAVEAVAKLVAVEVAPAAPVSGWAKSLMRLAKRRAAAVAKAEPDLAARRRKGSAADSPVHGGMSVGIATTYRMTELGNAQRFAAKHGDRLRYVQSRDLWLVWDGRRWCHDELGSPVEAAKRVVADLYKESGEFAARAAAGDEQSGRRAEELARFARASSKASALGAMVQLARSESPIAATSAMFDHEPFALTVRNGTLDLRTAALRPHRQDDMITKLADVDFDANAACPRFDAFLARVLPDADVRDFVQRYFGYALTGHVGEQVLAFFYGGGANGKSVLLDTLLALLGDYALRAAPDLVLAKHGDAHPTELADLEGRRLVVCSEIEQGRAWAESTIKRITGDTTITARKMRQDFYTFAATHKLIIAANTKPTVRGTDHAIWRRMRLVPFEVTIPPHERDRDLAAKLLADEAPGILAWAVRGCLAWQRDGLAAPAAIMSATEDYRAEQDVLGHWIADACVLADGVWATTATLYESYTTWCRATGREPWTRDTVRARLLERQGITESNRGIGRGLKGIGLRSERTHLEVIK
ncbi:MAG: phage/plasmid primase, P4 family [Kofleriaceae bacterium]|nr:phage/plasmid primase, P4 family [Kofleriaceae bacterium]